MMDLFDAAIATRGTATGANIIFCGVSTDSRAIGAGELFVALAGDRFDGHQYLAAARERGAVAAMVDAIQAEKLSALGLPMLAVGDTRRGLGRLAAHWRRKFALPVIAITGSNGKTTVKEMVASILRAQSVLDGFDPDLAVLATRGNLNNDIGLPLTLLKLHGTHRFAVVEMGMNHPGEIAYLAGIAAPTVALVNNAQRAHIEGMGTLEAVAREKGSIIDNAAADAIAVINADDSNAPLWRTMAGRRRVIDFALDTAATVRGDAVADGLGTLLTVHAGKDSFAVRLAVPGRHNARNALAAAAAAVAAGISLAAVQAGLGAYRAVRGRLQQRLALAGAALLDDSYNANPDSVLAGLEVLAALPGRRVVVFGDMGETGAEADRFHEEIGSSARALGIDALFALGPRSALTVRAFGSGGAHFTTVEELLAALVPTLDSTTTVLVKGSRFMKMERIADALSPADAGGEKH